MAGSRRNVDSDQEGYLPSDASVLDESPRSRADRAGVNSKCFPLDTLLEDRRHRLVSRSLRVQPDAAKAEEFQFDLSSFAKDTDALGSDSHARGPKLTSQALRQRAAGEDRAAAAGAAMPKSPSEDSRRSGSGRFSRYISQRRRQANFKTKGDINRSISDGRESVTESESSSCFDLSSEQEPCWEDSDFDCEFREWVMEGLDLDCEACSMLHLMHRAHDGHQLNRLEHSCTGHSCQKKRDASRASNVESRASDAVCQTTAESEIDGSMTFKVWRQPTAARSSDRKVEDRDEKRPLAGGSHRKVQGNQRRMLPEDPWAKVELGEERGLDLKICDF